VLVLGPEQYRLSVLLTFVHAGRHARCAATLDVAAGEQSYRTVVVGRSRACRWVAGRPPS
jgi:hypothetical protein